VGFIDALHTAQDHALDFDLAQKAIHTACILLGYPQYDKEFTAHGSENEHKIIQELFNNIAKRA
jgi:hypothetical protein